MYRKNSKSGAEVFFTCAFILVFIVALYYLLACFLAYVWDNLVIPMFWEAGPHIDQWQALALYIFLSIIGGLFKTTVTNKNK